MDQPVIEGIRILHHLGDQILDIGKDQVVKIPGFDLVAGAGLLARPVIHLASVVCLIDRLPHLPGRSVPVGPAYLLIP